LISYKPEQHRTGMEQKYINKVEFIEAEHVIKTNIIDDRYVIFEKDGDFKDVDIIGLSQLDISDKVDNKVRLYTMKLTAVTPERFHVGNKKYVFRVTTVTGEQYLIGTETRPYPVINTSESFPNEPTGKASNTLTVSYTQRYIAQIPII